jgi:DNA repair exonuclease SbcCD ATPase subunit
MIEIKLKSFKCWKNIELKFPHGEVTLLKGDSGIGKSTILNSISWCLYGVGRNITPVNSTHIDTSVTMNIKDINITRSKNPNRFSVTKDGKVFEDKIGQELINSMFGSYEIWSASCYIGQGCRNPFLTASNNAKMDLLNTIAFHDEEPSEIIGKISKNLDQLTTIYKLKLSDLNVEISKLNELSKEINVNDYLKVDSILQLTIEFDQNKNKIDELNTNQQQLEIQKGIYQQLKLQLSSIGTPDSSHLIIPEKITELSELFNVDSSELIYKMNENIGYIKHRENICEKLKYLNDELVVFTNHSKSVNVTEMDLHNSIKIENFYQYNLDIANKYSVEYNKKVISNKINFYKELLNVQVHLQHREQFDKLISQIEILNNIVEDSVELIIVTPVEILEPDYSSFNTEHLSVKLKEYYHEFGSLSANLDNLMKSKNLMSCPNCDISLRCNNHILISSDLEAFNSDEVVDNEKCIFNIKSEISQIERDIKSLKTLEIDARNEYYRKVNSEKCRIDKLNEKNKILDMKIQSIRISRQQRHNQHMKLTEEIDEIRSTLIEISSKWKLLTFQETNEIVKIISNLESIDTGISLPQFSSKWIKDHLKYLELLSSYEEYNSELKKYDNKIINTNYDIEEIKSYFTQISIKENDYNNKIKSIDDITIRLKYVSDKITDDMFDEISSLNNRNDEIKLKIVKSSKAETVIKFNDKVMKNKSDVIDIHSKLTNSHRLLQIAKEVECHVLEETVGSINYSLNTTLEKIFNQDISICLDLFKEIKTSKITKPRVNFKISHKGNSFDNINQMSGGESDRISLALTMALNRLSGCPLIMLDESLTSIGNDTRSSAIESIQKNIKNTSTVAIIILHSGVEGVFNKIIDISKF